MANPRVEISKEIEYQRYHSEDPFHVDLSMNPALVDEHLELEVIINVISGNTEVLPPSGVLNIEHTNGMDPNSVTIDGTII